VSILTQFRRFAIAFIGSKGKHLVYRHHLSLYDVDANVNSDNFHAARLGGDEFVILLEGISDSQDAIMKAEELQRVLAMPHDLNGHEVTSTASIGIVADGQAYKYAGDLLRDADVAMYRAKSYGKARCAVFDEVMHEEANERLRIEHDLRKAVDGEQLELYFQPIVKTESGEIVGFEALMRWNHPSQGLVSPDDFIPLAEETGLIVPLGAWALDTALKQLKQWQPMHRLDEPLFMSVNVSKRQLTQPTFIAEVEQCLEKHGVAPETVKLEITESTIMDNVESISVVLDELRNVGLQIAMDDFGTGHSSLSCLHQFPITDVKIDRAFMRNVEQNRQYAAVIYSIVGLAHNIGSRVIAEGIETAAQLAQLQAVDCDMAQGYFFAKPLVTAEAQQMLLGEGLNKQSA
jgi:EAL domain-containing protein (putative c-di-GMP-specific phosphodiesterase class I)